MGLLRHSMFIDGDSKGRPTNLSSATLTPAPIKEMNGSSPSLASQRKRGPPLSYVPKSQEPAVIPKRKSLSSLFRWRRDETPPPLPSHPLVPRNAQGRPTPPMTPLSPTSSVFSTQTAPVQRYPGAGVCSTLPSPASQYSPSVPNSPGGRQPYRGPRPTTSSSSLSSRSGRINISPPIPGVGDVPAHYRFRGEGSAVPPLPEMPNPRILAARTQNRLANRQSSPALRSTGDVRRTPRFIPTPSQSSLATIAGSPPRAPTMEESMNGQAGGGGGEKPDAPARGPPPRPGRAVGLGLGLGPLPNGSIETDPSPRAAPPPLQHPIPQSAVRLSSIQKGKRESEYIADSEVAALVTDAHIPPDSPVASVSSKVSATTPVHEEPPREPREERARRASHTPSTSISSISSAAPPTAWPLTTAGTRRSTSSSPVPPSPVPPSPSSLMDHTGKTSAPTSNRDRSGSGTGPSSILSNVSWASVGSGRGKRATIIAMSESATDSDRSDKVEALVDPPDASTPLSPGGAMSGRGNFTSSPSTYSIANSSDSSLIDPTPIARPLTMRPKSAYSTTAFSELSSPESSYSSLAHMADQESQSLNHFDGGRTPTSKEFYIQQARERREAMQITAARLEAELPPHQKYGSLGNKRCSYMSISAVSTGAVGNGSLSSRDFYRSSQLTVRDERRDSRRDSHGSAVSRFTATSTSDFSVPALLAEIDMLRRNGERLQQELFAVKSQVSLLLPHTELGDKEALNALSELARTTSTSTATSATVSPGTRRRSSRQSSRRMSSFSYTAPSPAMRSGNDHDGADSSSSTPSSSASDTWPITPVMNNEWSPGPPAEHLRSSISSYKGGSTGASGNGALHDARYYPAPSMESMSRIPRPVSSIRIPGTPPPRPPRAARRTQVMPPLPPGAAAAVAGASRSRASSIMTANGAD